MSMAWTWAAPLRASWTVSSPLPDPMSRQRWWAPTPSRYRYFQMRKLPWVGTNTPSSTSISGMSSGNISRPRGSAHDGGSRRLPLLPFSVVRTAGRSWPGLVSASAARAAWRCSGPHAAAAADHLGPLGAPAQRQLGVLLALDAGLLAPARRRQVAEVRVDAEREVGEVAQPGEHPGDVVGGDAVDGQRAHAHLLKAPGGAAEGVALGAAPVLAIDPADAVPAAPEAQPHRDPGVQQGLDGGVGGAAHQRQGLEQDQVGRLLLERA